MGAKRTREIGADNGETDKADNMGRARGKREQKIDRVARRQPGNKETAERTCGGGRLKPVKHWG